MARKNIFELINSSFDLQDEVLKIYEIFSSTGYPLLGGKTIKNFISANYFLKWKYRGVAFTCDDFIDKCSITYNELWNPPNNNTLLCYLEFVYNIVTYTIKYFEYQMFVSLKDTILTIVEYINYDFEEIDMDKYILIEKNPSATAVTEITEDTKVVEYNHYIMKGDLQGKRDILKLLANQFEAVKPNLIKNGYKSLSDDMGYLLNNLNIRHSNEGLVKNMSKEELEEWYDKTYDMFLLCILADNHVKMKSDIKALKQSS